jgi:hypothetical protein
VSNSVHCFHQYLDLTFARNPTLEDQALSRIHRMGQRLEVTTVRFVVRDSFEEVCALSSRQSD